MQCDNYNESEGKPAEVHLKSEGSLDRRFLRCTLKHEEDYLGKRNGEIWFRPKGQHE